MSKDETYTDKELNHGNGKRWANLFPENEIKDYDVEGFENVPSIDFDYPHGGVGKPKEYVVPGPPEFTPELIARLAKREPTTSLGRIWQEMYKEQIKK